MVLPEREPAALTGTSQAHRANAAALVAAAFLAFQAAPAAAADTVHVRAGAKPGGDGSRAKPLDSLAAVEARSRPGETIVVLRAASPLDGGIALKRGQQLIGAGPPVTAARRRHLAPLITNSSGTRLDGDAVRLANGATVSNLRIVGASRGAIYGDGVTDVAVERNDVSGQNASCTEGFHIPPFVAPTNVPGIGVPIPEGLINGWAAIMLDADSGRGRVLIRRNHVHDAECGDGIDLRISGDARYRAEIRRNRVEQLREGPDFQSLLAIGLQTHDIARLRADVVGNTQTALGNGAADSEGVFVNPVDASTLDVTVKRNRYTNPDNLGGFSANGMEMVSMGDGATGRMVIRDSSFTGSPGDVIEEGGLGTNATLELRLIDVFVGESAGIGNTGALPFNNGDCVLAGSLGAGNAIRLSLKRTTLANCSNNGLSVGSNVTNGSGPSRAIDVSVEDSTITGNRGANLGIRNFTALDRLAVRIQNTEFSGAHRAGSGFANVEAEDLGTTGSSAIDLGGGPLGSAGGNCITGPGMAASAVGYTMYAAGNWWGDPGGPRPGSVLGSVAGDPSLGAPPASC